MLRAFLSLVLVLPMLAPPGVCVCPAAPREVPARVTHCCHCPTKHAKRTPTKPVSHLPGCPVSVDTPDRTAPPAAVPTPQPPFVEWLSPATFVDTGERLAIDNVPVPAPPLFVTHCTLLI